MPIHQKDMNATLEFGSGDIEVGGGLIEGHESLGVVVFTRNEAPKGVGVRTDYKEPLVLKPEEIPVRMVFDDIRSIDVVIRALEETKQKMLTGDVFAR